MHRSALALEENEVETPGCRPVAAGTESLRLGRYVSRWDFILERCRNKRVLHLGCIGTTAKPVSDKINAIRANRALHPRLKQVAAKVIGVDYEVAAVKELNRIGLTEIVAGDVCELASLGLGNDFDVVLCADLIEHLGEPGRMLQSVRCCMGPWTEVLITTPNSFGLANLLRYAVGRPVDGSDHVLSFNIYTLRNLLCRHGYKLEESVSCYDHPPSNATERLLLRVGAPFLKMAPKFGGTLAVVARLSEPRLREAELQ